MKLEIIFVFLLNWLICLYNNMAEGVESPYLRSYLARSVYLRMKQDDRLRNMDFSKLYEVDELALSSTVCSKFVQLSADKDTQQFLDECYAQSDWMFTQIWHTVAKSFLGFFMTQTSVNGLLNRGRMFVWSKSQAELLLTGVSKNETNKEVNVDARNSPWSGRHMLDLGAGDGYVTKVVASLGGEVHVTEASPIMRTRLRGHGYRVLDTWSWADEIENDTYDLITCLNLLDRCDAPLALLKDIHLKLNSGGLLAVALVLPFNPYVEFGAADNQPSEDLEIIGSTLEEQVNSLAEEVFPRLGFQVIRWTKLPYLCEGDLDQSFYWLSDILIILSKIDNHSNNLNTFNEIKLES